MAECQVYSAATADFPGGVPVKDSCNDNHAWYFGSLWIYYGVKWFIFFAAARCGYIFKRQFRIGAAAYAGAYEIQKTCITAWTWYTEGNASLTSLDTQEATAGANWAILWGLMLVGSIVQYSLKDLETAVDQAEAAGLARAKLRNTMEDLQRDIQELRANSKREIAELSVSDPEIEADIKRTTETQIKIINVQLDTLKVSAKLAEEKVTSLQPPAFHLPPLTSSAHSLLDLPLQFLNKYAAMEKKDEETAKLHCCPLIPFIMIPMRKLDNAVLYAAYSGFYKAFLDKWQKRADTLAQFDVNELKGLTEDVAKYAQGLQEPESFASMGGLSFMESPLTQGMLKKAESMADHGLKFLKDRLEVKVCEVTQPPHLI